MTHAPDLAEPIAAWRIWRLGFDAAREPSLLSPMRRTRWPARTATIAGCDVGCAQPPTPYCGCGLYGLAEPPIWSRWSRHGVVVLGCTALWGRVIEATEGWRGERGYPLVLFVPPLDPAPDNPYDEISWRLPTGTDAVDPDETAGDAVVRVRLGERYAVPTFPLVWNALRTTTTPVASRAAAVRDEAAHGLAGRRLGDPDAQQRLITAATALTEALGR